VKTERYPPRLPASGNTALAASALIQAVLGIEFVLSGLNKFADPSFNQHFEAFVRASPGSQRGLFTGLIQTLVLPNLGFWAFVIEWTELLLGLVLLVGAAEIARRRVSGGFGSQHRYEAPVALVAAIAGLIAAALSFSIFLLQGGVLPEIQPGRAFTSAIPVELLITPLGLAIAWLEFGRFRVLKGPQPGQATPPSTEASATVRKRP
jgi:hypothetical protein